MHFGLADVQLYSYFIVFIVAVFFSWFIPGWLLLSLTKLKSELLKFLLAFPVGLVAWGLQGYFFGYGQARFLTYAYILIAGLIFFILCWKKCAHRFSILVGEMRSVPVWIYLMVVLSSLLQVYGHIGSGLATPAGVEFYFVNSVDGMMHLGYIQSLIQQFPPSEPGAVGLPLVNYHYWSDLVMADLARVWQLPVSHLFFQYIPLLLAVLTTSLFIALIKLLKGGSKAVIVGIFLLTVGSDATYLITQVLHGNWGENVASLDSGVSFYFNMPQVFARTIFTAVLILLIEWRRTRHLLTGLLVVISISSLFGFKVYYALYSTVGFIFVILFQWVETLRIAKRTLDWKSALVQALRHEFWSFILVVLLAVLSLSIYLPTNQGAGGIRYSFFEWPHLLLSADNIKYDDWFLRMQVYEAAGNTRNIIIYNLFAVALTAVAVYGTRLVGIIPLFRLKSKTWQMLAVFLLPTNLLFIILGLFTLQTSGGLNIYNFLIVPIVSFNLFAAFNLSKLGTKLFVPVFVAFLLMTSPRSIMQLQSYLARYSAHKPDFTVSTTELAALNFVKQTAPVSAVVQLIPLSNQERLTPYVAYFTQRSSYIAGVEMLKSHNQPTADRIDQLTFALNKKQVTEKIEAFRSLGITYLLVPSDQLVPLGLDSIPSVYQNSSTTVIAI